jgi:hypothetical protein
MSHVIFANTGGPESGLIDSDGHIAVSNAGLALLESDLSHGPGAGSEIGDALREDCG